jgi:hypothetical protein
VADYIEDREKESPEFINVRIRDPVNAEIPIEVTGCEKVISHVHRRFGASGIISRQFKVHDIVSCEIAIG